MFITNESARWYWNTACRYSAQGIQDSAVAAIMAGAQITSAQEAAGATKEAARINAQAQTDVNSANLLNSQKARGLDGLPVMMPLYTGNFEAGTMFPKATSLWNSATGNPADTLARNKATAFQFKGALTGANDVAKGLFTGARTTQRLAENVPVANARLAAAGATKQALNSNLQDRLSEMEASNANRGFVGGSTFDRSAAMRTAMPYYQEAASTMAGAKLDNALAEQGIRNEDWNLAFQNLNLPSQMAIQNMSFDTLPQNQAIQDYLTAYNVFSPFRLQEWQPPTMQAWTGYQPVQTTLGNVAGTLGNVVGSWADNQAKTAAAKTLNDQRAAQLNQQQQYLDYLMGRNQPVAMPSYSDQAVNDYAWNEYGYDLGG